MSTKPRSPRAFRHKIYNAHNVEDEALFTGLENQFLSELKEWILWKKKKEVQHGTYGDGWNAALDKLAENMK